MKDIPLAEQLALTPAQNAQRMLELVERMKIAAGTLTELDESLASLEVIMERK